MKHIAAGLVVWCIAVSDAYAQTEPSRVGQWAGPVNLPIVTIHMQVLPDGNVMAWGNSGVPPTDGGAPVRLWDPASSNPVFQGVTNPFVDVYCSSHTLLPDGRLLVIGGHIDANVGDEATTTFNPFTRTWSNGQPMGAGRWYPSATVLANGDVLTTSGDVDNIVGVNTLPQVYQTATGTWRDLTNARLSLPLYPWLHLAPNGKVFLSGPGPLTRYLDTSGSGEWTDVATTNYGANRREYQGTSVMYEPGKVLIMGGGGPATASAEVIDLNQAAPRWRNTNPMNFARRLLNATLLPDGKVLVTGGNSGAVYSDPTNAVFNAEIWDPATEVWTTMAAMKTSRLYHSTAVLLPDGRVLVSGGGADGAQGDIDHYDAEYYSPPYLFNGPRPTIDSAPNSASYGEVFTIGASDAGGISGVTLVALSGTTHEFNMSQRFVRLPFAATSEPNRYSAAAPAGPTLAPPGYYMLFVLNANGVPSMARMLLLGSSGTGNQAPVVNAGADQSISLPSSANLSGSATDDGQPGALTTIWSQVSGPGAVTFGNAAAPSTTASFSAAGTYVLRLTASDGAVTSTDDVTITVSTAGGNGLTGRYYNGINFNTLVFTRVDPTVDFTWGSASPGSGVQVDGFSIRWTGELAPAVTGTYTFSTVSNDGVRLYLNGQLIINNWTVHGTTTNTSAGIALQAGVRYPITMEYFENSGWGVSRLLWRPPGTSTTSAIPQARLFPSASPNQVPVVNAGADQTITLPSSANLSGSATDDGQPGPLTSTWSRVSGPGTVTFANAAAPSTTASFSAAGTYVLRLSASDGTLSSADDVTITVNAASNQAPVVNAGADQTITLPASANLSGSATDDGQPGPLTSNWSRVSGPGTVTFANAAAASTTASFSAPGTYVLRLSASDGTLTSTDDVTITVNAASSTGTGLTGRYYNGINFNTLVFTRVDPTVNFTWGSNSPGAGVQADGFSIRWTGQLRPAVTGTYTFSTVSNDGIRLYLNGQLIINNWTVHGTTTNTSAGIALQAGVDYAITLEYFENSGYGVSRLLWRPPGTTSMSVIPQARLFP
jgi:hypothetical protein